MHVLYVLSHHDDEYGCVPLIEHFSAQGATHQFVFMTACGDSAMATRRQRESQTFLRAIGAHGAECHFLGFEQELVTYKLFEKLALANRSLRALIQSSPTPDVIVTHAWEGGHADHDVCHALVCELRQAFPNAEAFQVPLYHMLRRRWPVFQAAAPLEANGPALTLPYSRAQWARYLASARHFESQWRVLLPLVPVMFASFARHGFRYQRIATNRWRERPHSGALMYEQATGERYETIARALHEVLGAGA